MYRILYIANHTRILNLSFYRRLVTAMRIEAKEFRVTRKRKRKNERFFNDFYIRLML